MKKVFLVSATAITLALASVAFGLQHTDTVFASAAASKAQSGVNAVGGGGAPQLEASITTIVNTLLYIVGVVAVIVLIVGGLQYILAAGDQSKITKAKDTILYAVVGIVVAALAFAIVAFVTSRL